MVCPLDSKQTNTNLLQNPLAKLIKGPSTMDSNAYLLSPSREGRCPLGSSTQEGGLLVKRTKINSSKNLTEVGISKPLITL